VIMFRRPDGKAALDPRSDVERFWSMTRKGPGGCVDWVGSGQRYGKFMTRLRTGKQKAHLAHRWIYEKCVGRLGRKQALHSCDRPKCVALQHLSPGTQKQNIADASAKGRRAVGERHPLTKLTEADVRLIRARAGEGESHYSIARAYGMSRSAISAIVARRTWQGVP
jgi:hypothetical protein